MSTDTNVIEKEETQTIVRVPGTYKVILHNDDSTTFDFVILVLTDIFYKSTEDAAEIAQAIHHEGQGIAGAPYTREVAEEKCEEVLLLSRANGYPLTATFEET
jgi:ATP-dependent Clp protease adaptor protein ClpS